MKQVNITLPDGGIKQFDEGVTPYQIALSISEGLARNIIAAKVDDNTVAIDYPIKNDANVTLLTWNDDEGKHVMWHSSSHIMASAIGQLYPGVKFGIGPAIENGFYYDIDFMDYKISEDDFKKIEDKFMEIARSKVQFIRREVSKQEALDYFTQKGNEYKLELINELQDGTISMYDSGSFTDLCRGPHIHDTSMIKAFKVISIAGAYWRGDEKRKQLVRVYGITFPKAKDRTEYLQMLEEAKKRDHRKIGKEMELFMFSPRVGLGLPIWLPKGAEIRSKLQEMMRKYQKEAGYVEVVTPHIGNVNLYKTSGHYQKYGADSFRPITTPEEGEEYFLKPMNCPHHCEIFASKPRSYKDLPYRISEFGTVYRYEQSGELHGLTRVRGFTQDDAHIFCTQEQIKSEFGAVINMVLKVFRIFGFNDYVAQISLRDKVNRDKYIGSEENWQKAESAIIEVAEERGMNTKIEYGEAAFYGPKMDFMVKDAIGRQWQLGTIQVDYNLPERFGLEYTGTDNQKHRPVMIHRAPFGSLERFMAVLIEHCAGYFPLWLTPDQIVILPISDKYNDYANRMLSELRALGIRGSIDSRSEKTGRKIRDAEVKKIPYIIVVGENEEKEGTLSVRKHGGEDLGKLTVNEFVNIINDEINKELNK